MLGVLALTVDQLMRTRRPSLTRLPVLRDGSGTHDLEAPRKADGREAVFASCSPACGGVENPCRFAIAHGSMQNMQTTPPESQPGNFASGSLE